MKCMRNMSLKEFHLFNSGCDIIGQSQRGKKSSVQAGVCFFPAEFDNSDVEYDTYNIIQHWNSEGVIVCFDIPESLLNEGFGIYPNWDSNNWDDVIQLTEYDMPKYNKDIVEPLYYFWAWDHKNKYYF